MSEDKKMKPVSEVDELNNEEMNQVTGGTKGDYPIHIIYCKLCNSMNIGHSFTAEEEEQLKINHANEPQNIVSHKNWRTKPVYMSTLVFE